MNTKSTLEQSMLNGLYKYDSNDVIDDCGHHKNPLTNSCNMLCDSHPIHSEEGYCYLKLLMARTRAFVELGKNPKFEDFLKFAKNTGHHYMNKTHLTHNKETKTIHVNYSDNSYANYSDYLQYKTLVSHPVCESKFIECPRNPHFQNQMSKCPSCKLITIELDLVVKEEYKDYVIGFDPESSMLQILEQMDHEGCSYHSPDPVTYRALDDHNPDFIIERDENYFKITIEEECEVELLIESREFSHLRHDLVMSNLTEDTDVKLEYIGVQSLEKNLTPDYISKNKKIVFELATSLSDSNKSLITDFNNKKRKYEGVLENFPVLFLIAVVSPTSVVCNFNLSQDDVDDLCSKVRLGNYLELKITDSLGYNPFNKEQSSDYKLVKNIFESLKDIDQKKYDKKHYDIEKMIDISKCEKNEDDDKVFYECVMKSIEKTKKVDSNESSYKLLEEYLSSFTLQNSRSDDKRICNVPMMMINNNAGPSMYVDVSGDTIPEYLSEIWSFSNLNKNRIPTEEEEYEEMMSNKEREKFNLKKNSTFRIILDEDVKVSLAMTGVNSKKFKKNILLKEKVIHDKKGFNPSTDTKDIKLFIDKMNLLEDYDGTTYDEDLVYLLFKSKQLSTFNSPQVSSEWVRLLLKTKLINFANLMTIIFTEIAYSFKHKTGEKDLLIKRLHNGISMIMKCTGTHTFVSYAYPKDSSTIIDTGRIGPRIHETKTHYVTEFCSYTDPVIEHFIKSGPYMLSLLSHLYSVYELPILTVQDEVVSKVINSILLMFLNNKHDCEEIITSQRYFFMKMFETFKESPYVFTERLPSVLRSRLSVYFLNKQIDLMNYYSVQSVVKIPIIGADNEVFYEYRNLKSLFFDGDVSLHQKVNEFYYGYVISKEKSRGSDRTFKIMQKILKEEYDFRDNVKNVFTESVDTKKFQTNSIVLKEFLRLYKEGLSDRCGSDYEEVILSDFIMQSTFCNFSQLSTLKASAKDHSEEFILPEFKYLDNQNKFKNLTKELNPNEFKRRPKAIEAVASVVEEFKLENNVTEVHHMAQLLPWCLNKLEDQNGFDSDIFSKSQHGGDREIHVLNMKARIVQYFVELLSKTICKKFFSETLTHPSTKENFVSDHYKKCSQSFETYHVMSKSADASKWCQRHHVSHFVPVLLASTPKILHNFILRSFALWTKKKISFSGEMVNILLVNRELKTDNDLFMRFKSDFFSGASIFNGKKLSNKIEIQSGMFQGILHYTSSLYHTMIQNSFEKICLVIASNLNKRILTTIVQGSDDSGMMIGHEGKATPESISFCRRLLRLKEELSAYMSVYFSVPKSSIGTLDLIEYNSEWHFRKQVIKPTFRWISACMQTNVVEKFIERIRIFYNVLTQCLEGGATTLECSMVQLAQGWMHYHLLGLSNHPLRRLISIKLGNIPDVKVGFFPFDFDVVAGIPGLDFNNYLMVKYKRVEAPHVTDNTLNQFDYEGVDKKLIPRDMQTVKLKFGNLRIWESMLEKLDLGTFEEAIQKIEDDPKILFGRHTTWSEERPMILLKMFSPGVKSSISNHSSMIRMVSAATYLITHPTLTVYKGEETYKTSWYNAILDAEKKFIDNNLEYDTDLKENGIFSKTLNKDYSRFFPLQSEYDKMINIIKSFTDSLFHEEKYKKSSKIKIQVFEDVTNDFSLIEACKRKWFSIGKLPLSSSQFEIFWNKIKNKYKFLKDDFDDTKQGLGVTSIEIKNILESIENKNRSVVFYDSPARGSNLSTVLTRVYWPNTKIRTNEENKQQSLNDLRSNLFSVATYWNSKSEKINLITNLIKNCDLLKTQIGTIPNRFRKLKIIQNYLIGTDKIDLLSNIMSIRQGVLGCFTVRQSGYGSRRFGDGIWNGVIAGHSVVIYLQDQNVKLIKVSSLKSLQVIGKRLLSLIEDFKSIITNDLVRVNGEKYYIDKFGTINDKKNDNESQLIQIDSKLNIKIVESLEEAPWSVDVDKTTIRLIANVRISHGQTNKMTILTESLSSRDWYENCHNDFKDENLSRWAKGVPCDIGGLQSSISKNIPNVKSLFENYVNSNQNKLFNNGLYDFREFSHTLRSYIAKEYKDVKHETKDFVQDVMEEDEKIKKSEEAFRILRTFAPIENFPSGFDWANEVSKELDGFEIVDLKAPKEEESLYIKALTNMNFTDEENNTLREQLEIFNDVNFNCRETDENDWKWNEMPKYNKFFTNIDCYSFSLYGKKLSDMCEQETIDDSFLSKLASIITLKYKIPKKVTTSQIELYESIMSDTMSGLGDRKLKYSDLDEEELLKKKEDCLKIISQVPELPLEPNLKASIIEQQEVELIKIEQAERFNIFYHNLSIVRDDINVELDLLIKNLCNLSNIKLKHKLCQSLTSSIQLEYLKQGIICEISKLYSDGIITMSQSQSLIYSIRSNSVTCELIDCLTNIYEFNFKSESFVTPVVYEETLAVNNGQISFETEEL